LITFCDLTSCKLVNFITLSDHFQCNQENFLHLIKFHSVVLGMEEECKPRVYKSEGDPAQDIVIDDKEDVNRIAEDISATTASSIADVGGGTKSTGAKNATAAGGGSGGSAGLVPPSPLSNGLPSFGSSSDSSKLTSFRQVLPRQV